MSDKAFFIQVAQNIESMISEGKLKEAYEKCKRYLSEYPEESYFIELSKKIENLVEEKNRKVILGKIDEVAPLWEKKDYVTILSVLKPLLKLEPNNRKVTALIQKAQEKYRKEVEEKRKEYREKTEERLNKLMKNDEKKFLEELFLMLKNNPGNKDVLKITKEYKDKLIKKKISEKEDLLYSDKFEDIYNFLDQLKKIDKDNQRVIDLEKDLKLKEHGYQLDEKGEYIYKSYTHLDTLMRLKKYDKAAKVADELLVVDKNNKNLLKIKEKAEKKVNKENRELAIASIKKTLPTLKKEYMKDKKAFIKI